MIDKIWDTHKGYVEVDNTTRLLSTSSEFYSAYKELLDNNDLFKQHSSNESYMSSGPLRECRTLHLINARHECVDNSLFVNTVKLVKNLIDTVYPNKSQTIVKMQVLRLDPGKKIYTHSDTDGLYWKNIERYQFYFNGNSDISQNIGNKNFPALPGYFYFFDHRQIHSYANNSNESLHMLVFDLMKNNNVHV
jgi:hypothetical protein